MAILVDYFQRGTGAQYTLLKTNWGPSHPIRVKSFRKIEADHGGEEQRLRGTMRQVTYGAHSVCAHALLAQLYVELLCPTLAFYELDAWVGS